MGNTLFDGAVFDHWGCVSTRFSNMILKKKLLENIETVFFTGSMHLVITNTSLVRLTFKKHVFITLATFLSVWCIQIFTIIFTIMDVVNRKLNFFSVLVRGFFYI